MLTERIRGHFPSIIVKIVFIDAKDIKRKIVADSEIGFSDEYMQIIARKLTKHLSVQKNWRKYVQSKIPLISEHNLHRILDLAKARTLKWWLFMNITLELKNVRSMGVKTILTRPPTVKLQIRTPHKGALMKLDSLRYGEGARYPQINQIHDIITKYGGDLETNNNGNGGSPLKFLM